MSKRRGLSLDEKRQRIMSIFFEKKEFFQLKEVEKIASKEKGINAMVIKDILQGLVDDGMVDSERVGTSNYYWAYPSKAVNNRRCKIDQLEQKLLSLKQRVEGLDKNLIELQKGRDETEERQEILKNVEEKKREKDHLLAELEQHKVCDPQVLQEITQQTKMAVEAANRWTENVFSIKSWCRDKFNVEENVINKQFAVPEDLDYIA